MTRIFSSGIRAAAVVCALLAAAVPLAAQIAEAELQGVVVDESGGVLPGVTLTLTHVETGTSRSVVTSDNGRYVARGLRVGDYDVVAELGGFATVRRAGITLLLGQSATLDIAMKLAVVEETLTVTGEAPLIDIGKSGIGSNLDVRQMQGLPLNGRDWMSLTLVAPGVRGGGGEQGPGVGIIPSFGGMNNYRTKVNVDGVQTNESTNFNSVDINFSQDSVREVQVLSNRFSAEFSRASGGIINAVTKSGTNKFSGSFYGFFRNDAFNAKHWFTGRVEPFEDNQIGGTIGGPLKKDRLHFFFSWESERRPQTQTPRNGIPLLEQSYPNDFTQDAGMLRFDYQLTPTHRLTARAASTSALLLNDNVDDHLSNGWDRPTWGQSYVLNSSWALSQRVLNEFRAQYINFDRPRQAKSHFPRLDFPGADLGTRTNSFAFKDEHLLLLRDDFSSYLTGWGGDHSLKLGGEYFAQGIGGIFGTNWFGYYRFPRNPTDWAQVIRVVEANDRAGLQDLLNRGIIPAPANAVFALGDASYWVKPKILGFYLQDDLKVSPALTLNLGVRYDVEIDAAKVVRQTRFLSRPDQQPRGKTDRNNWSPRVGFVYAFNQQRTTIRGGAGRYYDQLHIDGGIQNQVIFNGDTYAQANILYNRDPEFMINPLKGLTLESLIANNIPTNISAMSKTIHVSHADQLSIGAQHQLTETLAVQADIVHTVGRQEQYGRDINLFADPVTREPLPVAQYGRPDPRFGSINLTHYDGRSRYDALQVAATKRFSERYQYQASYILSWSYATAGANLDPTRPIGELYGPSDRDQRHRFVINATAQMPYEVILGGVFFASSGTRFGTDAGRDLNGDLLTDLARYPDGRKWPAVGGLGDSVYRVDLRVSKRVRLFKGVTVEGIGEVFNVFNRRNYIRYNGSQSSQAFLQPLRSTNLQYQPRMGQLAFRLAF